ncbi:GbsR/MarR family transcriptional regulator [Spirillospora sp. NPDC048911]|uniref:GbsR/MarR family transcriptional regulator n=1 Tax=Spirillospora sp. NPDC048911 TaxID=3364527 RepID=UPI00371E757F
MADTSAAAEQLALVVAQAGMQKSAARVMAAFLFAEEDSVTAGELSERLGISSGGVSGAIKMLTQAGLIERVPAPGSRREHYRFRDNAWTTLYTSQNAVLDAFMRAAADGLDVVGADSLPGRRLTQMQEFYAYLLQELPALIERWKAERDEA